MGKSSDYFLFILFVFKLPHGIQAKVNSSAVLSSSQAEEGSNFKSMGQREVQQNNYGGV